MNRSHAYSIMVAVASAALLLPGCATRDVNPPQAKANTGYVDFHPDPPGDLYWQVSQFDEHSQSFTTVFSKMDAPTSGFLRLAFPPGQHRLQVTILNRPVMKPAEIQVDVQVGKITPLKIALGHAGDVSVNTKEVGWGTSAKGAGHRPVTYGSYGSVAYDLIPTVQMPVAYQPKEQMPNAH